MMNEFVNALKDTIDNEVYNVSYTENGARGFKTTGKKLLDLNFMVPSLRGADEYIIINNWLMAYAENRRLALIWLFYISDVRGGLGERRIFRVIFKYLTTNSLNYYFIPKLLPLIPYYSRWDNLIYTCIDGVKEISDTCTDIIRNQLTEDMTNMKQDKPISLLAKWMPSINTSSEKTKHIAKKLANSLQISEKEYRKMLSKLRSYLKVVEVSMCANEWENIDYSTVPSKANLLYKDAFMKNDTDRRTEYLEALSNGTTKINASVAFPHEIYHKYKMAYEIDTTIEAMWKALPDYVNGDSQTMVVVDGSSSMTWAKLYNSNISAIEVSRSLGIYFSERCTGPFKDNCIEFSKNPKWIDLSCIHSLYAKKRILSSYDDCSNTDIEKVFDLILDTAVKHNLTQEQMVNNILIISDMEFDIAVNDCSKSLFSEIRAKYEDKGYKLPKLIFWNVSSRTNTIPMRENENGVILVSGYSPTICKMVLSNELDPYKALTNILYSDRYKPVIDILEQEL